MFLTFNNLITNSNTFENMAFLSSLWPCEDVLTVKIRANMTIFFFFDRTSS